MACLKLVDFSYGKGHCFLCIDHEMSVNVQDNIGAIQCAGSVLVLISWRVLSHCCRRAYVLTASFSATCISLNGAMAIGCTAAASGSESR